MITLKELNIARDYYNNIPEEEWCIGRYKKLDLQKVQYCAVGHLGRKECPQEIKVSAVEIATNTPPLNKAVIDCVGYSLTTINDYQFTEKRLYNILDLDETSTPKQRILKAIDLVIAQYELKEQLETIDTEEHKEQLVKHFQREIT